MILPYAVADLLVSLWAAFSYSMIALAILLCLKGIYSWKTSKPGR